MDCQYCGKIFTSDYNLRRHEGEYCPDRDNDDKECSPRKESRDADEASISSNESMGTHASHDDVDEDTEDESSSGNSSDEENDPWTTLINEAVSKVWDQYKEILQELLMEGHDECKAKEEAFEKFLPVFQKELADVYMNNLAWMKALRKDPIHKKIMATRDDYVNNDMFDQDEAIAAAVDKRKFLLKRLLEDQRRFPEE